MKKLYLLVPLLALFFSFNVEAAVSSETIQGTDSDGLTLNVRYQSYTLIPPIDMNQQGICPELINMILSGNLLKI